MKGVSLYLALIIMTLLLALALGVSAILFGQIRMMREMGNSVLAFYAADTGIERELYQGSATGKSYSGYLDLNKNEVQDDEDSIYNVWVLSPGGNGCPTDANYCIKSVGIYKETRRAIQVTR